MKTEPIDLSAEAITARLLAYGNGKAKPKPAKVVLPLVVSAEAAERAKADPQGTKFVTRGSGDVTHIERPSIYVQEQQELASARKLHHERQEYEALHYQPSYDPFAGLVGEGE